ncbi:hypothetical protein [Helicobacter pametensis]|uniref:hypothetical protein n=1 Tax=Helicobacter pametensis TaxID=95149 RepID=UPI00048364EA|nr:hypothetical protein [Helicobacter pametensis]
MNLYSRLNDLFLQRSKRERFLFWICLALGIYFGFFHPQIQNHLEEIQAKQTQLHNYRLYLSSQPTSNLQNLQEAQSLNQNLKLLIHTINNISISWSDALQKIHQYALKHQISLWMIDPQNEGGNYSISISGNTDFQNILLFLDFIEQLPLIHLRSFQILHNGNFSLILQNHKILSFPPSKEILTSQEVLSSLKNFLTKETPQFIITSPSIPSPSTPDTQHMLKLEAILNQKAKINGKWLQEGDWIDSFKLISIHKDFVILNRNHTQLKLSLPSKRIFE